MLKQYLIVSLVIVLSAISFVGFVKAASPEEEETAYVANFSYTPEKGAAHGSAGVAFAIGELNYKTNYNNKKTWFMYQQFENLDKAVKKDLADLLTAKGFSVRGSFDSYDLIPYQDKKASDLYLLPTVELAIVFKPKKTSAVCTGDIEIDGKIYLELREIITRELMWTKNIPFSRIEIPYNIRIPNYVESKSYDLYPFIMDDVAKAIEKQYPELMATVYKLIDPEEMGILKRQCQELRSKKGYQ
ncbi:MAG: hypothetical protein FJZ09_06340 [Candidatus Omnitrophica bacterium]|nr:hypothetical protein [Candidatus Omnitrophota bacterium]